MFFILVFYEHKTGVFNVLIYCFIGPLLFYNVFLMFLIDIHVLQHKSPKRGYQGYMTRDM